MAIKDDHPSVIRIKLEYGESDLYVYIFIADYIDIFVHSSILRRILVWAWVTE